MNTGMQNKKYVGLLFELFRKIDYRDKENSGKKKLTGIILAYLVSNTVLSFNFFSFFGEKSYVILTLTSNLFLIGIIVLNEFDNLFLAVKSHDSFIMLPLKSSEVFIAKFFSALIYLSVFIFACLLPQTVFFYFYEHDAFKTFMYAVTVFTFSYSIVMFLILVYLFILNTFSGKAHILLNILQLLFFIFVFYSSTFSSRIKSGNIPSEVKYDISAFGIVNYLPQAFYSESVYNAFHTLLILMIMIILIMNLEI